MTELAMGRNDAASPELTEKLKQRLFDSIGAQIDAIGFVPEDVVKLVRHATFESASLGRSPEEAGLPAAAGHGPGSRQMLAGNINAFYDEAFYNREGTMGLLLEENEFRNIGLWDESTKNQSEASERLQDALLAFIPEKSGRILDVACGMGASTRRLLNYYSAENVWAINISEKQIETTQANAPGCHAAVMNAVEMTFADAFFDNVLCIEAAFHFETRRRFIEEAHRVLRPGGRLVLSDVLFTSAERLDQYPIFPSASNHLATAADYRQLLEEVGYRNIILQDATREIWRAHFLFVVNRIHESFYDGKLDIVQLTEILWGYYHTNAITGPCLLISAQR